MNNKLFKKIAFGLLSIVSILLIVLVTHIYMATHKPKTAYELTQLSRIDFKQKIDSLEANKISAFVASQVGVKSTYFNIPSGILVYTYRTDLQNSNTIYKQVMQIGNYKAEKYVVSAKDATTGCPAGFGSSSTTSKLLSYFK